MPVINSIVEGHLNNCTALNILIVEVAAGGEPNVVVSSVQLMLM